MSADPVGLAWLAAAALAPLLVAFAPLPLLRAIDPAWATLASWKLAAACAAVALVAAAKVYFLPVGEVSLGEAGVFACVAAILAALAIVDYRYLQIPNLYPLLLGAIALLRPEGLPWPALLTGALLGGGLPYLTRLAFARLRAVEGLGLGDVKLLAAVGALLGPGTILWVIFGGCVLAIALALARGGGRSMAVPLGSALAPPTLLFFALALLAPN